MNRREFLARCAALGVSLPFFSTLTACAGGSTGYSDFDVKFSGKTLVLGAGSAGLAAGYLLARYGADYEILEASERVGGRVHRLTGFMDFPIDLGAEWIHSDPAILSRLIDDPDVDGTIDTIRYTPETYRLWNGESLSSANLASAYYGEYKFKNSTWFDFLEQWILPSSADKIRFDAQVVGVDTSGERVKVTLADGAVEEADRVIFALPIKILQSDLITFTPALPAAKTDALDAVTVVDGLKVFLEFEEHFFADLTVMSPLSEEGATDHLAIDGAYRKGSSRHLLTLFCVGTQAAAYVGSTDEEIVELLVSRLDAAYDGAASRTLVQSYVQNWTAYPHTRGAYAYDWAGDFNAVIDGLIQPVDDRLFWAGSGMSRDATSTVHGAMQAGYDAVKLVLETA